MIAHLLCAVGFAVLLAASPAGATIGWYAKWQGTPPITVAVSGPAFSVFNGTQRMLFEAAMADWSASPHVEFVLGNGRAKVYVDDRCAGSCVTPKFANGKLHSVALHFPAAYLNFVDVQGYFCHELGHALGLGEGYPVEVTGDAGSCMADPSVLHPSVMDFDVLAEMYPLGGGKR